MKNEKLNTMKLELKHLAPYLPYKLIVRTSRKKGKTSQDLQLMAGNMESFLYLRYSRPILRPLSDLAKEITDAGNNKFIFIETLEIGDDDNGTEYDHGNIKTIAALEDIAKHSDFIDIQYLPYLLVQELLKLHFDVFGLIGKGLAIDINTLKSDG